MRYLTILSLLFCTLIAQASDENIQEERGNDAPYNHFIEGDDYIKACQNCLTEACKKLFNCFSGQKDSSEKTE